jgi:hypothetical protein
MRAWPIGNGVLTARIPREFAALLEALQLHGATTDALLELEHSDWERLLELSDSAHLTLALAQLPSAGFPAWVVDRLQKNLADNALRYERVQALYKEVVSALTRAGVPHLVLKGFTQSPDFVEDPRHRMQGDIDLFCPQGHIASAVAAVEKIGYKPCSDIDYSLADHTPTLDRPGNWVWRGNMFDPDMPLGIEIHFCLWNEAVSLLPLPQIERFWNRGVVRTLGNFSFASLCPVDHLGYLALHILRNVLLGQGVTHHVHELASFLDRHATDDSFWAEWESTHSPRMRSLQAIAFSLAHTWFSCNCHPAVRMQVDALPSLQKAWLEKFGAAPIEEMFRRTKEGRLLQFMLAEPGTKRWGVLRRAVLPTMIAKPGSPTVRSATWKVRGWVRGNLVLEYLIYLGNRVTANGVAAAQFLWNGLRLYQSGWQVSRERRAFSLAADLSARQVTTDK